jgi:AraC-like DNA-binding protein
VISRTHRVTQYRSAIRSIEVLELTSNHSFPRHSHDHYGIGIVLSGAQRSWSGVGQVESLPGDVITVNPGEMHDGTAIGGRVRRWRILYFEPSYIAKQMAFETTQEVEFASPSLRDPWLARLVHALFHHVTLGIGPLTIEENLVPIIVRLMSAGRQSTAESRRPSPSIAKARARIDGDPSAQITLSELALLSGVSRYQLVRGFAHELGATPHAYIIQRRVRLARQLLAAGETIAGAAHRTGFADQSHLTRAFVRQFGVTPGRYLAARA